MLRRVSLALVGSTLGALLVAGLEASAAGGPLLTAARIDLGLIAPLMVLVGVAVGAASYVLAPAAARAPWERPARSPRSAAQAAAVGVLTVAALSLWTAVMGPLGARLLSAGSPASTGVRLALLAGLALAALVATGLALLPPVTRLFEAMTSPRSPPRPALAVLVALALASLLFGWGIATGEPSGDKGGLQLFAVLGRHELDLRPVADLIVAGLFAYGATWALARVRFVAVLGALAAALLLALTAYESKDLDAHTDVALAIERAAPLGRTMLAVLRKGFDRDRDGAARLFGGGDCNDRDPEVNPTALDVPGNGVDEDCSGEDERAGGLASETATTSALANGANGASGFDAGVGAATPTVTYHGETYNLLAHHRRYAAYRRRVPRLSQADHAEPRQARRQGRGLR